MDLKVLGSSSKGNCYILDNGSEALMIEAGVDFKRIKKALNFDLAKLVGCVITHEHKDHSRSVDDVLNAGIRTLALPSVFETAKNKIFARDIEIGKGYKLGNFKIMPFDVRHDVPCVGYLISHPDLGRLLFATDTASIDYSFKSLSHILIEANFADDILQGRIDSGHVPAAMRSRLYHTHMELQTTKQILKSMDLSSVDLILLIHLSDGSSDEARFVQEVKEATGRMVLAAHDNMTIKLNY